MKIVEPQANQTMEQTASKPAWVCLDLSSKIASNGSYRETRTCLLIDIMLTRKHIISKQEMISRKNEFKMFSCLRAHETFRDADVKASKSQNVSEFFNSSKLFSDLFKEARLTKIY